jgi:rhamnosyltransferase subunit B
VSLRVIIHTIGSAGDVHPFLGIGKALQDRGHEVFVVTNPVFETAVSANGLGFYPLGTVMDFQKTKDDPDLWHPRRAFPTVIRHAVDPSHAPILEITRELRIPGRTVMLASSLAFAARTASELLEIPYATVHLAPAIFPSVFRQPEIHGLPFGNGAPRILKRIQWNIAGRVVDHFALPGLNRFRTALGLAPAKHLLGDWWNSPKRVIALFPDWFAPAQPDWPTQTRQTGFPLFDEKDSRPISQELEEFLDAGSPPVVFTPGSAMSQGHHLFAEAAKALRRIGRRGIFLTPFSECLPPDLAPDILAVPYAPFSQILPRCAAIIYHGGIGTCAQALQAGIPQLIQPMAHDQLDTLSRIRELGVGDGIMPRRFKEKPLAAALEDLLSNPSYRKNAAEFAKRFESATWLEETCSLVEALAGPE